MDHGMPLGRCLLDPQSLQRLHQNPRFDYIYVN
jgi:hypothetical protein